MNIEDIRVRQKLSIQEQIAYMKNERGISFNIVDEECAAQFLSNSNYYFKLKAFEKNYSKYPATVTNGKAGKYCQLEFAYLQELSTLDMYLREIVICLSLDIEHYLQVKLMTDISQNAHEDGYSTVKEFLSRQPRIKDDIENKKKDSYCEQLISKYSPNFPVWVFIEVLSLGNLISFSEYYCSKYKNCKIPTGNLRIVKFLRNAAAHNNCLINNLADNSGAGFTQNRQANQFVSTIDGISDKVRSKKMGNRTIHDLVVLLCTYVELVSSDKVKKNQLKKLKDLLDTRFVYHKDYFANNALLQTNYNFISKVVDKLFEKCI